MKSIHTVLLNALIGLLSFIVFLLFFENRVAVPAALQVVGRAHPMLLHFPIVLLVLAWVSACFGSRLYFSPVAARRIVYVLLLASAWTAAITVIAGLLLAKEGGYEGSGFLWHKWMGVAVCFLAAVLLWHHQRTGDQTDRYRRVFLAGLSLSLVILLVAGHYGAALTHGEDYLFEPLRQDERKELDVQTAMVYQDVIYPILEAKCLSCHGGSKTKGGLVLADTAGLLKGGESGPALVKGSLTESLIIERLLLDIDHEHRMPPKGKPQLTADELALMQAWVASGADFNMPLSAVPTDDSVYRLALAIYGSPAEETYDFPPADEEAIARLNTPYRVVKPVAHASPALAVSFFGKAFYTEGSLKELAPVERQVVSLTLSGMPLSAADRDALKTFVNLRELIVNDTPVDDSWGDAIGALPNLRSVSVSGTKMTEAGLTQLVAAPKLQAVYSWNTPVSADALTAFRQKHRHIVFETGYVDDGKTMLVLNDPLITPKSSFFRDKAQVTLEHPIPGVELRYSLDGREPDSIHALVYQEPFTLDHPAVIRVKGYKSGWLSSREVTQVFHRAAYTPDRTYLADRPDPRFRGREAIALTDLESGSGNTADGKWLGYHGKRMVASMHFDTEIRTDTVSISVKQDYGSHIYPPKSVEIWGGADSASAQLLSRYEPVLDKPEQVSPIRLISTPMRQATKIRYLRVEAAPFLPIPNGYPAAGNPSWLFVDEILLR
ncbi:c-type cytochrome domain-containing protein [Parapedobacter sp. DT-150]|uniref:c-type cytochrome domain-containing protein n=1 Tax=Parapedobacter sp. DT-150 TaxID=3396162 RepID=UPI003F19FC08